MTTNDEWVRERAALVVNGPANMGPPPGVPDGRIYWPDSLLLGITVALQEAIERGEIEGIGASFRAGQQSILHRLENPDEAMVEAVRRLLAVSQPHAAKVCRALARTLTLKDT